MGLTATRRSGTPGPSGAGGSRRNAAPLGRGSEFLSRCAETSNTSVAALDGPGRTGFWRRERTKPLTGPSPMICLSSPGPSDESNTPLTWVSSRRTMERRLP